MAIFEAGLCKNKFGFDIEFAFAGFKRVYDCQRDHLHLSSNLVDLAGLLGGYRIVILFISL